MYEWEETNLGDHINFRNGKSSPDRAEGLPFPVYGSNGIIGYANKNNAEDGTIVVGRVGSFCGSLYFSKTKSWVTDNAIIADTKYGNDSLFFYYLLQNLNLNNFKAGSGQPLINQSILSSIKSMIPQYVEQRAIASVLGTLDDKIELNRRMNATLESMARALFKSWFVDFDPVRAKMEGKQPFGMDAATAALFPSRLVPSSFGDIPEGWEGATLEAVANLNSESWGSNNHPDILEYLDLANAKWGVIESTQVYSWRDAPSRARRVLRHGDTIVGTVRPGNGSYSFIGEDGLTGSTGFAVLRPKKSIFREVVYLAATSQENIERLTHLADGGAYPAVRPDVVLATDVVLPDEKILSVFSEKTSALFESAEVNKKENRELTKLRDYLLPKLISGDIRIPNAEKFVEAV